MSGKWIGIILMQDKFFSGNHFCIRSIRLVGRIIHWSVGTAFTGGVDDRDHNLLVADPIREGTTPIQGCPGDFVLFQVYCPQHVKLPHSKSNGDGLAQSVSKGFLHLHMPDGLRHLMICNRTSKADWGHHRPHILWEIKHTRSRLTSRSDPNLLFHHQTFLPTASTSQVKPTDQFTHATLIYIHPDILIYESITHDMYICTTPFRAVLTIVSRRV